MENNDDKQSAVSSNVSRWQGIKLKMKKPSVFGWPLGVFVVAALLVFGSASFQGMMYVTNQNQFCYSCHIGMDTIVEEYQRSVHFIEGQEPRATCADCHVPHDFIGKMIVKTMAIADIWYMLIGKINMENFEDNRLRMAEHVWKSFDGSDSAACRYCHNSSKPENWNLLKQPARARVNHEKMEWRSQTCIDCHYGIAHKRPSKSH